jgi:hypothetical protein
MKVTMFYLQLMAQTLALTGNRCRIYTSTLPYGIFIYSRSLPMVLITATKVYNPVAEPLEKELIFQRGTRSRNGCTAMPM